MRLSKLLQSAISATSFLICELAPASGDLAVKPITQLGVHPSPDHQFNVVLRKNSMGGGTDLFVMKGGEPIFYAGDATGCFWIGSILVYSSSPLYGSSGIYTYDPVIETRSSLVDGKANEYFELKGYLATANKVAYYYSDDISHLDITKLKASNSAVREVLMPPRG
jgi:hypothetical protein